MKNKYFLPILGALALPALLALRTPGDSLRFAPEADTEVSMAFTNSVEFFLDDFSAEAMGQDIGAMLGDVEANVSLAIEVAFADKYTRTSEGRPMAFDREFGDASITGEFTGSAQGESQSQSFQLAAGMSGEKVRFVFDEDDDKYTKSYVDDEAGDVERLDGLEERMDLAFLLPEEAVEAGAEWKIDPLKLATLLVPGGDLAYDTDAGDRGGMDQAGDEMNDSAIEAMRELMKGDVTGTYKGLNDDGLAEISIKLEIAGDRDMSDLVTKAMQAAADASGEEIDPSQMPEIKTFTLELSLDGEGTLLWDPRAGIVSSFSMSAETDVTLTVEMSVINEGMQFPVTGELILGGSAEIDLEATK